MPLPGTSGKIPAIRKTVTGQRLYTAKLRDRMMTSTVAKKDRDRLRRIRKDQFVADPAAGARNAAVQIVFPRNLEQQRKRDRSDAGGEKKILRLNELYHCS